MLFDFKKIDNNVEIRIRWYRFQLVIQKMGKAKMWSGMLK